MCSKTRRTRILLLRVPLYKIIMNMATLCGICNNVSHCQLRTLSYCKRKDITGSRVVACKYSLPTASQGTIYLPHSYHASLRCRPGPRKTRLFGADTARSWAKLYDAWDQIALKEALQPAVTMKNGLMNREHRLYACFPLGRSCLPKGKKGFFGYKGGSVPYCEGPNT